MRSTVSLVLCLLLAGTALLAQAPAQPASKKPVSIGSTDIKDYRSLAVKLRAPNDPVSEYVAAKLTNETKLLLLKYEASAEPGDQLKASLLYDLNALLKDQKFYSEERFKAFKLPDSVLTQAAKPRFKGTAALAKFNKQLIEAVYAAEFSRAAPKPVEQAKAEPPKPAVEDSAYTAANLTFAKGLAQRLQKPQDNLSKFVADKLSKPTKDSLKKYDGKTDPSHWLAAALAADLNKLLAEPKLYDEKRFKDVTLSDKARQRIAAAKDLKGAELSRCNKALLDEAYTTGLPPVAAAEKPAVKPQDTTQAKDLRPASALAPPVTAELSISNLMLSAPDTTYSTHLWAEGQANQKKIWRDSFSAYGDSTSGLDLDLRGHWDRSWTGPSWGNYQIVNVHYHTGQAKLSATFDSTYYDAVFPFAPHTIEVKRDSTASSYNFDWGLTLGGKKYLGNSPFFFFAENQDSQSLAKATSDSDRQIDAYISAGTGYGQVVDLANYVRAKRFEQALLANGIIAKPLSRAAMADLIRILQLRKTSQDRVVLVNKMLSDRGLVVKTTYTYDTIFLLTEILDQSTDQLESGLEIRGYYRQQVMAQMYTQRKHKRGYLLGEVNYARPLSLSLAWVSRAYYEGLIAGKEDYMKYLQLYEYGAKTGLKYTMALSNLGASVEIVKPVLYTQLKFMLHGEYGYKILNKVELSANYDYTLEKEEVPDYSAYPDYKLKVRQSIKRSEINLRLKYYFF